MASQPLTAAERQALEPLFHQQQLYCESLRLLLERFAEPLKSWSLLTEDDYDIIFGLVEEMTSTSRSLCDSYHRLLSQPGAPEQVDDVADTGIHIRFLRQYVQAEKLLQSYAMQHEQFSSFLQSQQRKIHTSLESLLRCPVDHVRRAHEAIGRIIDLDFGEPVMLPKLLTNSWENWQKLGQLCKDIAAFKRNEEKLATVELSFPAVDLQLLAQDDVDVKHYRSRGKHILKRSSVSDSMFKMVAKEALRRRGSTAVQSDIFGVQRREFVLEGPVSSVHKQSRYIFLFSDLLVVGKPKPDNSYKFKAKLRLANAWIQESPPLPSDAVDERNAFLVGVPECRHMILCAPTYQAKTMWCSNIRKCIDSIKATVESAELAVFPFLPTTMPDKKSKPPIFHIMVAAGTSSSEVIEKTLVQCGLNGDHKNDYLLYERNKHGLVPLQAWECPLPITRVGLDAGYHDTKCNFVLRHKSSPELNEDMLPSELRWRSGKTGSSGGSPTPSVPIQSVSPRMRRVRQSSDGESSFSPDGGSKKSRNRIFQLIRQKSSSSSPASPAQYQTSSSLPSSRRSSRGVLYERNLSEVMQQGRLPTPIMDMLARLYVDGPAAHGLFRKSANARMIRQVRERLDEGQTVDFFQLPILVVGACLKDYLRSLPDCLLPQELYLEYAKAGVVEDADARVDAAVELLKRVPSDRLVLLQFVLIILRRVSAASDDNSMTIHNLAVCVGPSLVWPDRPEDVLNHDVTPFVEVLIENCDDVLPGIDAGPLHEHASSVLQHLEHNSDDGSAGEDDDAEDPVIVRAYSVSLKRGIDLSASSSLLALPTASARQRSPDAVQAASGSLQSRRAPLARQASAPADIFNQSSGGTSGGGGTSGSSRPSGPSGIEEEML